MSLLIMSVLLLTVVTVNDYLARRDAEWMGSVHHFLGLSVGLIQVNSRFSEMHKSSGVVVLFTSSYHRSCYVSW